MTLFPYHAFIKGAKTEVEMTRTLRTLAMLGALLMAMATFGAAADSTDGSSGEKTGSGHGDRITWPCPKGSPTA